MDLGPLRSFLTLASEGNMTRAAAALHLTQPAVSSQLARLEADLGQSLFDRTSRGMVLTPAGDVFRAYVEDALSRLEEGREALDQLAGLERGRLSIGGGATATTYLLPPLLGRFHERYPGIQLFVREQGSRDVMHAVLAGELDLGVVTLPLRPPRRAPRLTVEPWVIDELRLIAPPGSRLAGKRTFRWKDLDGQPLVLFEAGTAVRNLIDRYLSAIQVEIVMESRSIESIKHMVAEGIGAAFVSHFALSDDDATGRGLRCREGSLQRELALIHRADHAPSAAARAFLELLRSASPS